jgi:hypothetical protein
VRRGDEGERAVLNRVVRLALRRGVLRFMLISVAPATDRNYALSSVASVRQQSSSLAGLGAVICVRMHASMHRDHDGHMATIDSIPLLHFPLSPPPSSPSLSLALAYNVYISLMLIVVNGDRVPL